MTRRSPTEPTYDVIVVGARAAGAATSLLLARAGLRVVTFERAPLGTDTISTHALMRGGVLQLARWGVLGAIVDAGTPPVRSAVYNYGGTRRRIAIKPAHGVDAFYAPRRTVLDPILVAAASGAGAGVHHGVRVTGLIWEHGRVVGVRTAGSWPSGEVRAPLVIGADGIRSIVARQAGARRRRLGRWHSEVTYGYWRGLAVDGYEWTYSPDACIGAIPTGDGLTCVFAAAPPGRLGRGGVEAIRSAVDAGDPTLAERLTAATAPTATRTWAGTPGFVRTAHGPGWALVGDAGYFKDPLVAHGLTDALRDAELLARAVIAGLDGNAELVDALAHYEATRDRLSEPLFEIADRIASHEWDDAELDELVRRISSVTAAEVDHLAGLDEPVVGGAR